MAASPDDPTAVPPEPPRKSREVRRDLADAYQKAVEDVAERRRSAVAASLPDLPAHRVRNWFLAIMSVVLVWIWLAPPAWVAEPQPEDPPAVVEASLRAAMYSLGQRLEKFRADNGEYPATLEGFKPPEGFTYTRPDPNRYELRARDRAASLVLTSGDDLTTFLGNSLEVINRPPPASP